MGSAARGPKAVREQHSGEHPSGPCRDELDPEMFFPRIDDELGITAAKRVCTPCPSRVACLEWALANGMDSGVWGGKSEQERRALKRQRSRA